jgi:serine/threonine protein kinase/sugar lactone lactonase YvrE
MWSILTIEEKTMAPESHSALPAGYSLGEYEIEAVLGHGGFGVTYLARDKQLGTKVAIKEYFPRSLARRTDDWSIEPSKHHDPQLVETYNWGRQQFLKEAQALGKFKHNNIVRVLRFLEANGTAYMVMEYEVGQSLSRQLKMRGGNINEQSLLRVFVPILNGLQAIHEAGLLHRDIKPENIYLRSDDTPMLIDFGAVSQSAQPNASNQPVTLTPAYAAIEQYPNQGEEGPWTDIYGLGATMYRCIIGEQPAGSLQRFNEMRQYRPDPLTPITELKPEAYSEFVLQCVDWAMQIYPRNRPQTARELQDGLMGTRKAPAAVKKATTTAAANQQAATAPVSDEDYEPETHGEKIDRFKLILASMFGLILIAAIAIFVAYLGKQSPEDVAAVEPEVRDDEAPRVVRQVVSSSSPLHMVRQFTDSYNELRSASFVPATDQVVAAGVGGDLIVWDINSGRQWATLDRYHHTVRHLVSLGGKRVASADDAGKIMVWDIAKREAVKRMDGHSGAILAMAITPDRKWLVSGGRDQKVIAWNLGGGKNRVLAKGLGRVSALAISPDGREVAVGTSNGTIHLIELSSGGKLLKIDTRDGAIETLSFSPDGATLASAGLSNDISLWDANDARLQRKLKNPKGQPVYSLVYSRKGELYAGDGGGLITIWDTTEGLAAHKFFRHRGRVTSLVFSPDGKTLASTSADKSVGLWAVY